jgi:hypothetical protein
MAMRRGSNTGRLDPLRTAYDPQETFAAEKRADERRSELVRAAHSPFDYEYAPFAGNTLEQMTATVQARTRRQILNGARHQHLAIAAMRAPM